jgi:predicted alpha/beta hydrolase
MSYPSLATSCAAIREASVNFPALDEYVLEGTFYCHREEPNPPNLVLFNCGGAVPASRYRQFARHLASNRIAVLLYDYRGIGKSRPSRLRGFGALAEDWSEFDCGGAIAYLRSRFPKSRIIGMAHSIGALLMCGAPNVGEISQFIFICAHTGYWGDYRRSYRLPMVILWHGVMPVLTRVFGYFPARFLGLGEDIPAGIAMQWAARRNPEMRPEATAFDARRARAMMRRYRTVRGEVLAVGFADDAFATPKGTRRLLEAIPGLQTTHLSIEPSAVGMPRIGHFGFFSRSAEPALWPTMVRLLRDQVGLNAATPQAAFKWSGMQATSGPGIP